MDLRRIVRRGETRRGKAPAWRLERLLPPEQRRSRPRRPEYFSLISEDPSSDRIAGISFGDWGYFALDSPRLARLSNGDNSGDLNIIGRGVLFALISASMWSRGGSEHPYIADMCR